MSYGYFDDEQKEFIFRATKMYTTSHSDQFRERLEKSMLGSWSMNETDIDRIEEIMRIYNEVHQ